MWQAEIEDKYKAHVEELTTALRHASRIEIERRFLLRGVPDFEAHWTVNAIRIEQGYLPGDAIVERVRRVRSEGVTKHFRTLKVGKGAVRHEFEEQISTKLFRGLYALTESARILKTRHQVADPQTPGLIWEIDVFQDRVLVLAEIELGSDSPFEPPEWLKPWIISEVTEDGRFTNASLARTRQIPKLHRPKAQPGQTQEE